MPLAAIMPTHYQSSAETYGSRAILHDDAILSMRRDTSAYAVAHAY